LYHILFLGFAIHAYLSQIIIYLKNKGLYLSLLIMYCFVSGLYDICRETEGGMRMWLILWPVLVAIVGVILIVIRMAYQQREQDRQAGRRDDGEDTPVFMIGFTDKK